jgi:hypothetical protein
MLRILLVLAGGLALGALMASGALSWPIRPGLVGLLAMAGFALAARRRWLGMNLSAPGSPERGLWIGLGSSAVIAGHLVTALASIGAGMVMHTRAVHALGVDNWTLVLGGAIAWWIARDPDPRRDERDLQIAALGLHRSHYTMVALLIAGLVPLGFGWSETVRQLSHPMIAHLLIVLLMLTWIVDNAVRLREYRRDASVGEEPG